MKFNALLLILILGIACQHTTHSRHPLVPITWANLHSIEMENFNQALRFQKDTQGIWHVETLVSQLQSATAAPPQASEPIPVETGLLSDFLSELAVIELGDPIAQKTQPETFEINRYSPQMRFYDQSNRLLSTIFIGKKGSDQNSTYVMRSGDPDVYWVETDLRSLFLKLISETRPHGTTQEKN